MKRGTYFLTAGGSWGWYVGTLSGIEWVAYTEEDFYKMVERFEAKKSAIVGKALANALCDLTESREKLPIQPIESKV